MKRIFPFFVYPPIRRSSTPGSFDSFFVATKCRIEVVLSFRRPSTPCGINYMYGVDGSILGSILIICGLTPAFQRVVHRSMEDRMRESYQDAIVSRGPLRETARSTSGRSDPGVSRSLTIFRYSRSVFTRRSFESEPEYSRTQRRTPACRCRRHRFSGRDPASTCRRTRLLCKYGWRGSYRRRHRRERSL